MSRAREFTQNTFLLTSSSLFNMFVAVTSMFFYTHILNPLDLALLPILEILSSIVYVVSSLGLGLYVQRRMPALERSSPEQARELARGYALVTFAGTVVCTALIGLLAAPLAGTFLKSGDFSWQIHHMLPAIVVTCWWTALTQLFLGRSLFADLSWFSVYCQVVHPLSIIGGFFLAGTEGLLWGLAAGKGLVCCIYSWRLRDDLFGRLSWSGLVANIREAWPFNLEGLLYYPMNYADRWLVGIMLNPVDLAVYYIPRTMYDRMFNLMKSVTNVMIASLSVAHAEGVGRFLTVFRQFRRLGIFLFTFVAVTLTGLSYYLVDLLAGPDYHAGILPFALLMVALQVQGVFTSYYLGVLTALPPKSRLFVVTLQSLAVFIVVPVLGWFFALNGIAGSRAVIMVVSGLLSVYCLREVVPLELDLTAFRIVLLPSLAMLAVLIAGQLAWYNLYVVPFYLLAGLVLFIALFLRHLPEADFQLAGEVAPARLRWAVALARRYRQAITPSRLTDCPRSNP